MEQNHTPGPWRLGKFKRGADFEELPGKFDVCVDTDNGVYVLASTNTNFPEDAEANARRIVACVNACDGLSTDELERFGLDSAFGTDLIELEKQRDMLLAELEKAIDSLEYVEQHLPSLAGCGVRQERIESGRVAIAAVKGDK